MDIGLDIGQPDCEEFVNELAVPRENGIIPVFTVPSIRSSVLSRTGPAPLVASVTFGAFSSIEG